MAKRHYAGRCACGARTSSECEGCGDPLCANCMPPHGMCEECMDKQAEFEDRLADRHEQFKQEYESMD